MRKIIHRTKNLSKRRCKKDFKGGLWTKVGSNTQKVNQEIYCALFITQKLSKSCRFFMKIVININETNYLLIQRVRQIKHSFGWYISLTNIAEKKSVNRNF